MRSALLTLACLVYAEAVQYKPYGTTVQSVTGLNDVQNAYTVIGDYANNIGYDANYGTKYKDVVRLLSGHDTEDSNDYSSASSYDTDDTYDVTSDDGSSNDYDLVDDTYVPDYDTYSALSSTTDGDYEVISYQPEDKYGTYTKYGSYGTDLNNGYGAYNAYDTDYSDDIDYGIGDYGSDNQITISNEDVDKSTNYDNPIFSYDDSDYANYQPYTQYYDNAGDVHEGIDSDSGVSTNADYNRHGVPYDDNNNHDMVDYEVNNPPVTHAPIVKRPHNHHHATKSHGHNEQAVMHKFRAPWENHHLTFSLNDDGHRYNFHTHNNDYNLNGYEGVDRTVNIHGLHKPIPVRIKQNIKQKRMIYHDKYEKELLHNDGYKSTYGRDESKFFDKHAASRYSDVKYQPEYEPHKYKPMGYSTHKYDIHDNLYDIHSDVHSPRKHFDKTDNLEHYRKHVRYTNLENDEKVEDEKNEVHDEKGDFNTKADGNDDVKVVQDDVHDFEADLIAQGKVLGFGSSKKGTRFEQITTFHHGGSLDPSGKHMKRYGGFNTKGALKNYGEEFAHLKHGLIGDLKTAGRFDGLSDDDAKRQFVVAAKYGKHGDNHDYGKHREHGNRKGHRKIRFRGKSHKNGDYHAEY